MIANSLDNHGVAFRYEQIVYIDGSQIVPGFTIMTRNGEIFWEHAGLLDDPTYSFRHHAKMIQYESAGYYPWKNLIVTYDTGGGINLKMVDATIENIILPAL